MKMKNFWKSMSGWLRAFFILAFVFLALGLGTLGSVSGVGDSYVLSRKMASDDKDPCIIVSVSKPEELADDTTALYVKKIYLNIGTIYTQPGKVAHLRIARGGSASSAFSSWSDVGFENFYQETEEGKDPENANAGAVFNWVTFSVPTTNGWSLSSNSYYKLTAIDCDMMINEIVFVANDMDGTGKDIMLDAVVDSASILPFNSSLGETSATAVERASAVVDSGRIPSMVQSSFFRFGDEELPTVLTVAEMRRGNASGEVSSLDTVHNSLGIDLVALGAAIFGMSPFGLRFVPFLFAFGTLVFGFLFVKKLAGEKAGFAFALLYALASVPLALGHLATPLMIGVGFFMAALNFITRYFFDGVKEATFKGALPVLLAGLFTACAICTDGAFAVPAVAIVALFAFGLARQIKERRRALDGAIESLEAEEAGTSAPAPAAEEGGETLTAKQQAARTYAEYHFKVTVAPVFFFVMLVFGAMLISVLAALPLYYSYTKLYGGTSENIFYFMWKAFAGGFAGTNPTGAVQAKGAFFYALFRGTGERAAVTATGALMAIVPIVAGLYGIVRTLIILFKEKDGDRSRFVRVLVLFCVAAVCLASAFFVKETLAYLLIVYLMLFAFAGYAYEMPACEDKRVALAERIVSLVLLFAAAACFGLFSIYTFSIPAAGFLKF